MFWFEVRLKIEDVDLSWLVMIIKFKRIQNNHCNLRSLVIRILIFILSPISISHFPLFLSPKALSPFYVLACLLFVFWKLHIWLNFCNEAQYSFLKIPFRSIHKCWLLLVFYVMRCLHLIKLLEKDSFKLRVIDEFFVDFFGKGLKGIWWRSVESKSLRDILHGSR